MGQRTKHETVAIASAVLAKLADDQYVRQELPGGGRLRLDRRLPFVCVYRRLADGTDAGTEKLITSETAYLVIPAEPRAAQQCLAVLHAVVENLASHFGGFLLLELWAAEPDDETASAMDAVTLRNGVALPRPHFEVVVPKQQIPRVTVEALTKALKKVQALGGKAEVAISRRDAVHPPGMKPLIKSAELSHAGSFSVGLAVRPVYRDSATRDVYPSVVRAMRRGLNVALKQAFFTFAHQRTSVRPDHYYALGRRSVVKAVFEIDHQLAAIGRSFDLLLQATPVNAEAAWREFRRSKFERPPVFYYRPLTIDPLLLKRQLYLIPVERIEDPTLSYLFRQKQDELDRQITLLADIDSSRFLPESLQIYGGVSDNLFSQAKDLLDRVPTRSSDESVRGQLTAEEFAARAAAELDYYRQQCPDFDATVAIREDMYTGMMVSADQLLIGGRTRVPRRRADALLQHEVGTHLVTHFNGSQQPFQQLEVGLAGYDGLQEGLAVLAEYLVGGLSRLRIRILAARVVAARQLLDGATFIETFRSLDRTFEFSQRAAYTIAMRTYRGGGLTKDAVYLRGLLQILKYLGEGGDLEPLFIGKIASAHLPLIAELQLRQVVKPPALRPRYLDAPEAQQLIQRLRDGATVLQLLHL